MLRSKPFMHVSLLIVLLCGAAVLIGAADGAEVIGALGPFHLVLDQCEAYVLYHSPAQPRDVTLIITVLSLETRAIENVKVDIDGSENGPDVDLNQPRFLYEGYPAVVRVQASTIAIATEADCTFPDKASIEVSLIEHGA